MMLSNRIAEEKSGRRIAGQRRVFRRIELPKSYSMPSLGGKTSIKLGKMIKSRANGVGELKTLINTTKEAIPVPVFACVSNHGTLS